MAASYIELKRYDDALSVLQQTLEAKPDHASAHAYRGLAYMHLERFEEARDEFIRALRIKPRLKPLDDWKNLLGDAYYALGQWNEALEQFKEAAKIRRSASAYGNIAGFSPLP